MSLCKKLEAAIKHRPQLLFKTIYFYQGFPVP